VNVGVVRNTEIDHEDVEARVSEGPHEGVIRPEIVDVGTHHQRRDQDQRDRQSVERSLQRLGADVALVVAERNDAMERQLAARKDDLLAGGVAARGRRPFGDVHERIHRRKNDPVCGFPQRARPSSAARLEFRGFSQADAHVSTVSSLSCQVARQSHASRQLAPVSPVLFVASGYSDDRDLVLQDCSARLRH